MGKKWVEFCVTVMEMVGGLRMILCDTGSEGYGSKVRIHFRNGDSPVCCVTFLDGPLKGSQEVTFAHLLCPLDQQSCAEDVFYKRCDRVEVYDPGSKYDGRKGCIDSEVARGKEIFVKLDDGETIFTYTKFVKKTAPE